MYVIIPSYFLTFIYLTGNILLKIIQKYLKIKYIQISSKMAPNILIKYK